MIRFGHIADCHINKLFIDEAIKSLSQIQNICIKEKSEFLIIAGDLWDKLVHLTEDSPLNRAATLIKNISEFIPIIIIYGNHDVRGSLEIFEKLSHNITVVSEPTLLCRVDGKIRKFEKDLNPDTLFFAFPYARKEAVKKKLKEELGQETVQKAEHVIESYIRYEKQKMIEKVKHLDLNKIFKIGIAHGTMQGSSKADGQDSRYLNEDVHFIESTFDEMDYVALGHIHKFQTIGKKHRACYPSSIYSVNFSEEDDKFCLIVELDDDKTLKILPKKLNVQIVKTLKEDLNKLPPRRREILNRLNELNETLSKDKNTRWKIKFFGLRAVLEYIKEIEWHDNIKINENPTDEFSIGDIVVPETLTFEQKIKKYIKDVKGVEWSESLSDKLNIINDEKEQYYNVEEDEE